MRSPVNRLAGGLMALGAAGLLAACSASPVTVPAQPASDISDTAGSPAPHHGVLPKGVTIAAQAGQLRSGPFTIRPTHCGKLTAAQQNQFGTTASSGLVYRFTNTSRTLTGAPALTVNFLDGATMVGSGVTRQVRPVGPGRAAAGEVDAVGMNGEKISFGGCELMGYAVATSGSTAPFGNFAP